MVMPNRKVDVDVVEPGRLRRTFFICFLVLQNVAAKNTTTAGPTAATRRDSTLDHVFGDAAGCHRYNGNEIRCIDWSNELTKKGTGYSCTWVENSKKCMMPNQVPSLPMTYTTTSAPVPTITATIKSTATPSLTTTESSAPTTTNATNDNTEPGGGGGNGVSVACQTGVDNQTCGIFTVGDCHSLLAISTQLLAKCPVLCEQCNTTTTTAAQSTAPLSTATAPSTATTTTLTTTPTTFTSTTTTTTLTLGPCEAFHKPAECEANGECRWIMLQFCTQRGSTPTLPTTAVTATTRKSSPFTLPLPSTNEPKDAVQTTSTSSSLSAVTATASAVATTTTTTATTTLPKKSRVTFDTMLWACGIATLSGMCIASIAKKKSDAILTASANCTKVIYQQVKGCRCCKKKTPVQGEYELVDLNDAGDHDDNDHHHHSTSAEEETSDHNGGSSGVGSGGDRGAAAGSGSDQFNSSGDEIWQLGNREHQHQMKEQPDNYVNVRVAPPHDFVPMGMDAPSMAASTAFAVPRLVAPTLYTDCETDEELLLPHRIRSDIGSASLRKHRSGGRVAFGDRSNGNADRTLAQYQF